MEKGMCFCACRCCDNCGGEMHQRQRKNADCQRGFYAASLTTTSVFMIVGILIACAANHNVSTQIKSTRRLINTNMRDLKTLANNTPVQIEYLTAQYTTVKNKVLSDLNNIGPLLGGRIHSQLEKEVVLSLDTALRVAGGLHLHAILIMVQATTLNVAFNSHKSLLTIMMSHTMSLIHIDISRLFSSLSLVMIDFGFLQFVETKGSVFKKFEKNSLFQMSNCDIKERFTNYILLLIVCLRNMEQFSWNPDHLWVLFPDLIMVIASEVAVDVVKHAFITKFNDISADVYGEYRASLAFDLVSSRQKNLIRVVTSSVKIQGSLSFMCVLLFYLGMITLKVLNSIILLGTSCVFVRKANMEEKLFDPPPSAVSSRVNSRAHRTKHVHISPQQEPATDTGGISVTLDNSQPTNMRERSSQTLPKSDSDTFLTTPDEDGNDKIINSDIGLEGDGLKHRTAKKDLLEIDRFTICGNRID